MNEVLRAARLAKGYTQEQMAKMLGYKSKSGYCMLERGPNDPPLKVALKIAAILEKPVEELFSGRDVHETGTSEHTA
ncbi:helix-turn-helix transcriptional regulator [Alicyclobacillus macrosporangiidus]|uniref:helix-turn-helix transcriptional regulator n=1 Tax=Alicyclobacillus macrosporangiidus TaxID=392015 RepID=UPI000496AEE2|nr:helix-turn-helix transcriptional regulator [Alicyclobacillus macrosporangiidus]